MGEGTDDVSHMLSSVFISHQKETCLFLSFHRLIKGKKDCFYANSSNKIKTTKYQKISFAGPLNLAHTVHMMCV